MKDCAAAVSKAHKEPSCLRPRSSFFSLRHGISLEVAFKVEDDGSLLSPQVPDRSLFMSNGTLTAQSRHLKR